MAPSIHDVENQPFLREILGLLQSHFKSNPFLRILDIGCGAAHFTEVLGRELGKRAKIVGIDSNADVVREATERIGTQGIENVELKVSDILQFDEEEKYDLVMFTKSLHHCLPLDEVIHCHRNAPNYHRLR